MVIRYYPTPPYSVVDGAAAALQDLANSCRTQVPVEFLAHVQNVAFLSQALPKDDVYFPCPLKEQEAAGAIKAFEACAAAAIADLRLGKPSKPRDITVNLDRAACFLMSAYISTLGGMDKQSPAVKSKLPDTDINQAQSILYRRLSANLYATATPGQYYHIHGSLEASTTLRMLGLETHRPDLTGYRQCIDAIESVVKKFTVDELEELNTKHRQAGVQALTFEDFKATPHGTVLSTIPPFAVTQLESSTPPTPFPSALNTYNGPSNGAATHAARYAALTTGALEGIKVLELCRVIAGPTIGRSLAAHGASVLKITSPSLPDVPFFQVDVNTGKHCASLDLRAPADRQVFESLLREADVVLDGYRPGALSRLGYGAGDLAKLGEQRGKGYVYVAEDCFGGTGLESYLASVGRAEDAKMLLFKDRAGWQQIADCATGVAWAQGKFMGLNEPVVPPFPMSDYGTGSLGALAALTGLWRRHHTGGSWSCRTSLAQYDLFVLGLGLYPNDVQERLRKKHDAEFFDLRHSDSVDEVGKRALKSLKRLYPWLVDASMMAEAWSEGFNAPVKWPKESVKIDGVRVGYMRPARPNGADPPVWGQWEVDCNLAEK